MYANTHPSYPHPVSLSTKLTVSQSHPQLHGVYVTRGAMLHRATWKFSSLRVHTRTRRQRVWVACLGLCGVLYDSIVALMAPLCGCVGGGAHGKLVRARQRTFSTYTIRRTRPANYISHDRGDFTNTEARNGWKYIRTSLHMHAAVHRTRDTHVAIACVFFFGRCPSDVFVPDCSIHCEGTSPWFRSQFEAGRCFHWARNYN